ncbi:MAG: NADP-dependent isocitrate dehydrogenase [Fimbriimonadaceae bacterium]|nr:NADP-dependent isocitrate dehydrogenase [Fimbriimonadaceae bacterium]
MAHRIPITVAHGDGIGPEIMKATLRIFDAAGAPLDYETIEIGESVYLKGVSSGIPSDAWESLRRTKVFLKSPITTPQGGGYKSLNVTVRKTLGLYANVRPCVSYSPYIVTRHPDMNVVIVRENEEDLYAGIEHRQTQDAYQTLKLVTRPGTEKIVRYAFEYARANGRKKVSCFTKDNIMKLTDGLFHSVFDEVGKEYSDIEQDHWIIDIGSARLADTPSMFDVIVTSNLYGDIISDIAAQITGSVGLGGSANVGESCAMFEAIHGSAPPIAGKGIANPSGLLLGSIMMLVHIGLPEVAERIHNAWLRTIEDGIHTQDIYRDGKSIELVGTDEFAEAVATRLGQKPNVLKAVHYDKERSLCSAVPRLKPRPPQVQELVGVDIFVKYDGSPNDLAAIAQKVENDKLNLRLITNRGVKVWPDGYPETFCTDHWRLRFRAEESVKLALKDVVQALDQAERVGLHFIKTEQLYTFDGIPGFTLGQGE